MTKGEVYWVAFLQRQAEPGSLSTLVSPGSSPAPHNSSPAVTVIDKTSGGSIIPAEQSQASDIPIEHFPSDLGCIIAAYNNIIYLLWVDGPTDGQTDKQRRRLRGRHMDQRPHSPRAALGIMRTHFNHRELQYAWGASRQPSQGQASISVEETNSLGPCQGAPYIYPTAFPISHLSPPA